MQVIDQEETCRNIASIIKITGTKVCDISKTLNVSRTSIYKWMWGKNVPTLDNLVMLADLLGVTIADLVITKKIEL